MKGETVDLAILALRLSALGAAHASSLGGLDEPTVKAMFRRLDNDLERIAELHEKEIAAHLAKAAQGEAVAYFDPDTHELHLAGHIDWSRKNGVDVSGLVPLGRMDGVGK